MLRDTITSVIPQAKRKKSEAMVRKCDMEYYAACIKTERSRLDWEGAVRRGGKVFHRLEEERLQQLQAMAGLYLQVLEANRPKLVSLTHRLREPVALCDTGKDVGEVRVELEGEELGEQVGKMELCVLSFKEMHCSGNVLNFIRLC